MIAVTVVAGFVVSRVFDPNLPYAQTEWTDDDFSLRMLGALSIPYLD